jgi:hypothetical protein
MTAKTRPTRPARCVVCCHEHRARIEALVVGGASQKSVARRFRISNHAISRHFLKGHITRERKAELLAGPAKLEQLANAAADESRGLIEEFRIVRSVLLNQFLAAAEAADRQGVALIAARLLQSLHALGRLTGELREVAGVNVTTNIAIMSDPRMVELQSGLLTIARAHPGARAAIIALLRGLDAKAEGPPMIEGAAVKEAEAADAA